MDEVRRADDDELCGLVGEREGRWVACTVFGGLLGTHDDCEAAVAQVLAEGLASLAERWTLRNGATDEEEVACILEANPAEVTVARDYYAGPGVPTLTITLADLQAGTWSLTR